MAAKMDSKPQDWRRDVLMPRKQGPRWRKKGQKREGRSRAGGPRGRYRGAESGRATAMTAPFARGNSNHALCARAWAERSTSPAGPMPAVSVPFLYHRRKRSKVLAILARIPAQLNEAPAPSARVRAGSEVRTVTPALLWSATVGVQLTCLWWPRRLTNSPDARCVPVVV